MTAVAHLRRAQIRLQVGPEAVSVTGRIRHGFVSAPSVDPAVATRVQEEVDTSYPGWERNEKARQAIKQEIIRALIDEGESDLIKEGFPEETLSYVIASYTD